VKRGAAILLAFATALPVVYMFYFFTAIGPPDRHMTVEESRAQFEILWRLHMGTMALMLGLLVIYIVYLFKTDHVPKDKKALWAVVLFMGNIIAMPVFWFLYVWKPLQRGASAT
jgi:hypothetical protein